MSHEIEDRIGGYFDESLSAEEMTELADWIRDDPANAQQFARTAMLHDRLQSEMSAIETAASEKKIVRFPTRWLAAAAAVVVLFFGIWQFWPSGHSAESFATIARVDGTDLKVGERNGAESIELKSGMMRMLFDSGVEVTIQGPAEFELAGGERMILRSGLLTANVPPGAEGFRVDTPTVQVTDLGTAFGVRLDSDGASHVSVFDGEVEISEPKSGTRKRLLEGEEVVITSEHEVETVPLDAAPYEKIWPVSSGIEGSTGSFQLAPPWPRRLSLNTSDDYVFVVPDGYRMELDQPLKVNISTVGKVADSDQLSPAEIPAGSPLRSFVLHFRPEEAQPRRLANRLTGTITFDRPIAGLIVLHEELTASAGRFSKRRVGEAHPRRELELNGKPIGDRITLSEDMRTLTVDLAASKKSFDLIRVVVDASAPELAKK